MKKFLHEFKEFAMRGNVIDMAVGIVIGGAFTAIVNSLVDNIITPLLGLVTGGNRFDDLSFGLGDAQFTYGAFISAVINFVLVAFVLFLVVKAINKLRSVGKKKEDDPAPTTKVCPFCKSEIAVDATRCPHCTSLLDEPGHAQEERNDDQKV